MRGIKSSIAVVFLVGAVIYLLFFSQMFLLRKVECNGCSDVVMAELVKEVGKRVFEIKNREISDKLLKSDLTLAEAKVKVKLPNVLVANLKKRIPTLRLTNDISSQEYLSVDEQGVVLNKVNNDENSDLPILVWQEAQSLNIGDKVSRNIVKGAEILNLLQDKYDVRRKGKIENNDLLVNIINGPLIKFSLEKEVVAEIKALQLTMDQVRIDSLRPVEIDLRFIDPIVIN